MPFNNAGSFVTAILATWLYIVTIPLLQRHTLRLLFVVYQYTRQDAVSSSCNGGINISFQLLLLLVCNIVNLCGCTSQHIYAIARKCYNAKA